jgi:2-polyprenyl-3-methyl-5-hydroxy-6-metoxy-1,4-benzoquinol methylase
MESKYEEEYLYIEKHNPWYVQRREMIFSLIAKENKDSRILDYGCSIGIFLQFLKGKGFQNLKGYEPSFFFSKHKDTSIKIFRREADIKREEFDIIFLLDVIEHIKEDKETLRGISELLSKDGKLIISVPAFNMLWSYHDTINKHYRRYTKKTLQNAMPKDLIVKRAFYWNSLLFLPTALMKVMKRNKSSKWGMSDFSTMASNPLVLKIFDYSLKLENILVRLGINFPFGTSLIFVTEKKQCRKR